MQKTYEVELIKDINQKMKLDLMHKGFEITYIDEILPDRIYVKADNKSELEELPYVIKANALFKLNLAL